MDVWTKRPVIGLAPMAGVTDRAFRLLAKEQGADLVVSEMVSAKGICYDNERTVDLLSFSEEERPISLQIFGSEPDVMARAACIVAELEPDVIDINMGCPTPKIVKNGDGSALMKNPDLAESVVRSVVRAVNIPVSAKIRLGWDDACRNAVEIAKRLEDAGAAFIAVHGRTREQFYSGRADYDAIAEVKSAVRIPVLGNGDVASPQAALRLLSETHCDGILIGRGAMGNPWIFRRVKHYLATGEFLPEPSVEERIQMIRRHMALSVGFKGESTAMKEVRKHIGWYLKGAPHVTYLKQRLHTLVSLEQFDLLLREWREFVNESLSQTSLDLPT